MKKTLVVSLALMLLMVSLAFATITDRASIRKDLKEATITKMDVAEVSRGHFSMYYRITDKARTEEVEQILQTQGSYYILGKDSEGNRVWTSGRFRIRAGEAIQNTDTILKFKDGDITVTVYKNTGKVVLVNKEIKLVMP